MTNHDHATTPFGTVHDPHPPMTIVTLEPTSATCACPTAPSFRALEVATMFGLSVDDEAAQGLTIVPACEIPLPLASGGVVLITGPSGSGKSSLLRALAADLRQGGHMVMASAGISSATTGVSASTPALYTFQLKTEQAVERSPSVTAPIGQAVIDLVATHQPLRDALHICSLAGLSDAFVLLRRPEELSDGQRFRFELAQAMARAMACAASSPASATAERCVLVIDEFAATLDRITAAALARNVRRWSTRAGIAFILATTHEDVLDALEPDVLIYKGFGTDIEIVARPAPNADGRASNTADSPAAEPTKVRPPQEEFAIEPGTLNDYRALAAFHYRSHHPGAATSVLRLVHRAPTVVGRFLSRKGDETQVIGVLVRSMPALACRLRDRATSHRYGDHLAPRERACLLNDEVRCISRVVIDPRFRSLGLAARLVRHALEHPESERLLFTEALAAMGRVSPFFEHAGMRRFDPDAAEDGPAQARLLDALAHAGLSPLELAATEHALIRLQEMDSAIRAWLMNELRRFLRGAGRLSRQTLADMGARDLINAVRRRLVKPVYFVFQHMTHGGGNAAC
jgi:ABC-type dipeptide/oligopeptide/nickel transport system ATPase subunit/GNAT superfamily N-acetyltransferase